MWEKKGKSPVFKYFLWTYKIIYDWTYRFKYCHNYQIILRSRRIHHILMTNSILQKIHEDKQTNKQKADENPRQYGTFRELFWIIRKWEETVSTSYNRKPKLWRYPSLQIGSKGTWVTEEALSGSGKIRTITVDINRWLPLSRLFSHSTLHSPCFR